MSWSESRSRARIQKFLTTVPQSAVAVRQFDEGSLARRRAEMSANGRQGDPRQSPLSNLDPRTAVVVDGVHVYIQVLDFSAAMIEQERETDA